MASAEWFRCGEEGEGVSRGKPEAPKLPGKPGSSGGKNGFSLRVQPDPRNRGRGQIFNGLQNAETTTEATTAVWEVGGG